MNTRGLTELVLLQVGLKLKVLDVPAVHDAGGHGHRDDRHDRAVAQAGLPGPHHRQGRRGGRAGAPSGSPTPTASSSCSATFRPTRRSSPWPAISPPPSSRRRWCSASSARRQQPHSKSAVASRSSLPKWPQSWANSRCWPRRCGRAASTASCCPGSARIRPQTPSLRSRPTNADLLLLSPTADIDRERLLAASRGDLRGLGGARRARHGPRARHGACPRG